MRPFAGRRKKRRCRLDFPSARSTPFITHRTMASAAVAPAATASVGAPSMSASASAQHPGATAAIAPATTAAGGGGGGGAICNSSLDEQIERLRRCEYLREGEVKALCLRAREILVDESNVQRVDAPVTVSSCYRKRAHTCVVCVALLSASFLFTTDSLGLPRYACQEPRLTFFACHMRHLLSLPHRSGTTHHHKCIF